MQSSNSLQMKIEVLEKLLAEYESNDPLQITKKWRIKVFEELVRNKQQQITHSIEVKRFKEEERRLRVREQEVRNSLEGAHQQVSQLNSEILRLQKDLQISQQKAKSAGQQGVSATVLMSVQSNMSDQIERSTRVLALIETYYHRLTFALSKIKTIKMLHNREKNSLKARLSEEMQETKKLREDILKAKLSEVELEAKNRENLLLKNELELLKEQIKITEIKFKSEINGIIENHKAEISKIHDDYKAMIEDKHKQSEFKDIENKQKGDIIYELQQKIKEYQENTEILKGNIIEKDNIIIELNNSITAIENSTQKTKNDLESECNDKISKFQNEIKALEEEIKYKNDEIIAKNQDCDNLQQQIIEEVEKEKEFHQSKITKLEQQCRELRRDRDILFQTLNEKKSTFSIETQTDVPKTYTPVRKTPPPQLSEKIEDLEVLSKELLDFQDEFNE
ncbi:unnamed protein product [Blepharisma stoltei]|uniref:Uncharacterized protein n=1 Tax=Blepharisma stoltei TaxID=1481888 RepID=A0AAU9IZ91_9CILI|nr:unnamed protein product [Blepharisma stoltei]